MRQELDITKEQLESLLKHREESDLKSKADVKLLVREVKSLRSFQLELKQEAGRLAKERTEFEVHSICYYRILALGGKLTEIGSRNILILKKIIENIEEIFHADNIATHLVKHWFEAVNGLNYHSFPSYIYLSRL